MKINDIPITPHYALLEFSESYIHHEGDERSRTHPGHGYPAYTETVSKCDYRVFDTLADIEKHLSIRTEDYRRKCRIIKVDPLKIQTTVSVAVG